MSLALDPFVQNKLDQFVNRRRRWTWIHAVLIGLAVWLVGILVFTWADAVWIMDRPVRLVLSLLVYVAAAVAVTIWIRYRSSGKDPVHKAAIEIERGDPRFRDQLLSTVELVRGDYDSRSLSFIAASQRAISQKMRAFDVGTLLPWRLLAKPFAMAMSILLVCCLLVLFPKLEYTSRFARAIIPGFDIDRVSRTRIAIERPQPASTVVPANETTAIVVSLYGQAADRAILQWYDADGQSGKTEMQPSDNASAGETGAVGSFAANLSLAQSIVKYRIKAGDGVTAWYTLEPQGRPEIKQLDAVITQPGYSQLPDEELKNFDGNLKGFVGSVAQLSVTFNMPIKEATLRRLNLDSRQPMMQQGDVWTADISINEDDRYQILAVAAATGFDNPLSPQYRIQAVMDEVPLVRWADASIAPVAASSQKRKRELVTNFSLLKMSVSVSDEMPIRRLRQEIRINGGEWISTNLIDEVEEPSFVHRWDWNLETVKFEDQKLSAGDVLETRIVATDRKGGRGESEIKDFIISDHQFDNSKRERLQSWGQLAQSIHVWRAAVAQRLVELKVEEKLPDLGDKWNTAPPEPLTSQEFQTLQDDLDKQIMSMMDQSAADHESAKLEQLARAMFATRNGLEDAAKASEEKRRDFRWVNSISEAVDKSSRAEVGHHLAIVIVDSLQRMQASIYPTVREHDPVDWRNFAKYFEVAKEQYQELAQTIASASPDTLDSTRRHYEGRVRQIEDGSRMFNEVESKAEDQAFLRNLAERIHREVREAQYNGMIDNSTHDHQNDLLKRLQNEIGWTKTTVEKIVRNLDEVKNWTEKSKSNNTEEARAANEQLSQLRDKQDLLRSRLLAQLTHDGDLHQHQKHPDQRYIADAHLMRRVIETISESSYVPAESKSLRDVYQDVANAYQWLEAGHEIKHWLTEVQSLAEQDRWSADTALGRVDAPHQIARITQGLEYPTNAVQNAGLQWQEVEPIAKLRWDRSNAVRENLNARRWANQAPVSGADKLTDLHAAGLQAIEPLEKRMEEARQLLNSFLPSIAELAAKTAESLRETKVEEKKPEVTEQVQQAREDVERRAETLKEQLIDEANTQEMISDDGRRKARNADISLQAIDKRLEEVNAAQEQLAAAPESQKQQAAEQLNQAAEAAAKTMEQISQHYEKEYSEDANQDQLANEKSPLLEQLEKELDLKSKLDQEYARLNALANALQSDPRELLKKLQQELARNPLMQQELDAIADQTLLEAQKALDQQAERERSLQLQLEQSDPQIAAAKRDIEQAIRDAGREAHELQRSLMDAANRASEYPNSVPESMQDKSRAAREQLREASRAVEQAVNQANQVRPAHDERLANLAQTAEQVAEAIEQANQVLEKAKQPLAEMANDNSAQLPDKRREELAREMERVQSTARNSQSQLARETAQRKNQLAQQRENELKSAKQNASRERENLKRTEERLNKEPENEGLKQERQRIAEQVAKLDSMEQVAQSSAEKAKQAAADSKARAEAIAHETLPKFERSLPTVELAERMQNRSEEGLKQIADQLKQLSNHAESLQASQPDRQRLTEAAKAQPAVEADVTDVAEDMARAARHQQRLGETDLAKTTADAAAQVKQLAEGQVHEATSALERAQAAATAEQPSAEAMRNEAQSSYQELGESESALRQQAEALAAANEALDAKTAAERAAAESAAAAQAAALENARQKARTLDDLDRALAAAQRPDPSGQQSQSGQPGQQSASQQSQKSSTLAAEARKQAQQMAKQRSQAGQEPSEQQSEGEPSEDATESGEGESKQMADFYEIEELDREGEGDWAKLREREIDDVTEEERPEISPEYRRQIEAYFRAVAERSKGQ